jgi:hypothetical protein
MHFGALPRHLRGAVESGGLYVPAGASKESLASLVAVGMSLVRNAEKVATSNDALNLGSHFRVEARRAEIHAAALTNAMALSVLQGQEAPTALWGLRRTGNAVTVPLGDKHVYGVVAYPSDPHDTRFTHEGDPLASGGVQAACPTEYYPSAANPATARNAVSTPVTSATRACISCGAIVTGKRAVTHAACRACAKQAGCSNQVQGLRCGYPLAYGKCAKCLGGVAADVAATFELGVPIPVVSAPTPVATVKVPTVSLLKNVKGNPSAPPRSTDTYLSVNKRVDGVCERTDGRGFKPNAKPRVRLHDPNRGPVLVGPCGVAPPAVSARCRRTNMATLNGRVLAYPPDPAVGVWDELWDWTESNWDTLFGGPRAFKAPKSQPAFGTPGHAKLMRAWASSFKPLSKAQKKHRGVDKLLAQGGTHDDDLVLTMSPKRELLQGTANSLSSTMAVPACELGPDSKVTGHSGRACQRALRYYDTAVVDALCGPDCSIAYKTLGRCWSGDHPLRLGGSRDNHATAQFFEKVFGQSFDSFVGRDFTLMDNSHGAAAHVFFYRVMRKAGFFCHSQVAEVFRRLFPQTCVWKGLGTVVVHKGMASGAVWTTLMNTLLNGLMSQFAGHKAWSARSKIPFNPKTARVADYHGATRIVAAYQGDDSATMGIGIAVDEPEICAVLAQLGYLVKSERVRTVWELGFLGCTPMHCYRRLANGEVVQAISMVPMPHRFLTSLGWSLDAPADPALHCGAVGFGWYKALAHVPGYGPLLQSMAVAGGAVDNHEGLTPSRSMLETWNKLSAPWAEYCGSLGSSASFFASPLTVATLAEGWRTSPDTVMAFHAQMCAVPSFPCLIGTAEVRAICLGSSGA